MDKCNSTVFVVITILLIVVSVANLIIALTYPQVLPHFREQLYIYVCAQ